MSRTEIDKQALKRMERNLWQSVLLAVTFILFPALTMLALQICGVFQEEQVILFLDKGYQYSIPCQGAWSSPFPLLHSLP